MMRKYYSMEKHDQEANINIYGDISSYPNDESAVSAKSLSKALEELADVSHINVYINSYGGEVAEGLAIYNALKRHKAKVTTYCDGFAASIASVIFMAGDKRVMSESSLLMIHNAWMLTAGNAEQLRKDAEDLDKITQASVNAYKAISTLTEEEIKALMDAETWILPEEALEYGFATHIKKASSKSASQSVRNSLFELIKMKAKEADKDEPDEDEADDETDEEGAEGEKNADDGDEEETPDEEDGEKEKTDEDEKNEPQNNLTKFFESILKM